MAFPLDRIQLGPRAYGPRPATYGVTLHTTEYPSSSLAHGLQCVRDQSPGGSLYAGGGSYNFILTDEGPILTVPYLEASGGISGNHTPPPNGSWAPKAILNALPTVARNDPNAYMLQVSVSGKAAALQTYPAIDRILGDAVGIIRWANALFGRELLVHGHRDWQTDRSDPGQWFLDQVKARMEGDMAVLLKVVRERWTTRFSANGSAGYFTTDGPGIGERKWFTAAETVESYAETTDGRYRAISYNGGTETLWMERRPNPQMDPIPGSRLPPTGFGLVTPDCTALANAAKQATASKAEAQVQAWIATRPPVVP